MKFYKFANKAPKKMKGAIKKNYIIRIGIILIVLILVCILGILYTKNSSFRAWSDKNIFRKEITNENTGVINIDSDNMPYIYAYDKYVVTLEKNNLKGYSFTGKKEIDADISVSKPIFASSNRFLAVAESYGKRIYLLTSQGIAWEKSIDGEISRVCVNKNGYVSIAITRSRI